MADAADSANVRMGVGGAASAALSPADVGTWQVLPFHSEVLAVHAALLPSGDVLFAAGSGNSLTRFRSQDFGDVAKKIWVSVVWDPTISPPPGHDTNFFHPATPHDGAGKVLDFFCGGETFLPDGGLLSAGGTLVFAHPGAGFAGMPDTVVFDPATEQWVRRRPMQHGRWYPSLINLGDGRVLATAGLSETGRRNTSIETFFPGSDSWQVISTPPSFGGLPLYAHLYLLADGSVCYAGGHMDDGPADALRLDLTRDPVVVTPLPGLSQVNARDQCASVLLPPAQAQRVMIMGGAPAGGDAVSNVDIADFSQPHPAYQPAAALAKGRKHLNATLLPDRTVLVTGGSGRNEAAPLATNEAEVYDPGTDSWRTLATASVTRMYHSVALLLPDGRVVTASGNPKQGTHVEWDHDPNEEMRLEIYSPPYLFKGPRPVINAVRTEWNPPVILPWRAFHRVAGRDGRRVCGAAAYPWSYGGLGVTAGSPHRQAAATAGRRPHLRGGNPPARPASRRGQPAAARGKLAPGPGPGGAAAGPGRAARPRPDSRSAAAGQLTP